jgi:hypothetical protein
MNSFVLNRLQVAIRRKIFITKELLAKYSPQRGYGHFRGNLAPVSGHFFAKYSSERDYEFAPDAGEDLRGKFSGDDCAGLGRNDVQGRRGWREIW